MKKIILSLCAVTLSVSGINAQGFVAGWDFAGVTALDTAVNGYVADRTGVNNGVTTSGSISTTLAQGSQVFFAANGNAATDPGFGDGFDQTTTDLFGGSETGQQSLNFTAGSSFNIVFNFSDSYDVVINADWLTEVTGGATDILDISYSSDGGATWTTYNKANGQYAALASTSGWTESDGDAGGFIGFVNGGSQSDMTIDLTSVTSDADSAVNAVRFEFNNLSGSERVGLDNVHISGIAVDSGGDGVDSGGDGVGDNYDAFPDDATETADTDADGGDGVDSGGDGVGDNATADDTDGWYSEASDLGWHWLDWFGYFNSSEDPWLYHNDHGWTYVFPSVTDTDSVYLWDNSMQSVLWTSETVYPFMYRFSDGTWIWYLKGSSKPRWIYNFSTVEWEQQ